MIYFSSDHHHFHKNIIRYDNRPFDSLEEMTETIIDSHNRIVKENDDYYFLGDFSFGSSEQTNSLLKRMNGNKYFIKGNHDNKDIIKSYKRSGIYLGYGDEIKIEDQKITICHYAHRVWNGNNRGSWMLYGHSHGSLEHDVWGKSMDVGVMTSWNLFKNWEPISFEQIKEIMNLRNIKAVDHHI